MRAIAKHGACLGLVAVLCFQLVFVPRAKALDPMTLVTVAAGATVGALAACVAAYFKANGVDMTLYNIASGASAQEAMSNLIQEFLNDTRDGMDINDYVSGIGLADKVFYRYYSGAANWVAAQVQTVISALGVATIFDPILTWFVNKYSGSGGRLGTSTEPALVYVNLGSGSFSVPFYSELGGEIVGTVPISRYHASYSGQSFSSNDPLFVNAGNLDQSGTYIFSTGSKYINQRNSGRWNQTLVDRYGVYGGRLDDIASYSGLHIVWFDDDTVALYYTSSANFYLVRYNAHFPASRMFQPSDILSVESVGASQDEDDGTNRFPSTAVPNGFQLEIPSGISDNQAVQGPPAPTETPADRSAGISNAILDSMVINDFTLAESPSVVQEQVQPTVAPTEAQPTAVPTGAEPTVIPTVTPGPIPEEYTPDITDFFPFCIPFDLARLFTLLEAEPEAPYFTMPFPIVRSGQIGSDGRFTGALNFQTETIEIDFRNIPELEAFMAWFRNGQLILFVVGLAVATRKFIRW